MDVIQKTRELGKAIQADSRYSAYFAAKEANDNDADLQNQIGDFNVKRMELNSEMSKEDNSPEKLAELDKTVKALYDTIMNNQNMAAFTAAKDEMDNLLSDVNAIITMSANGEDPETCSIEQTGCSGGCGSCGGCH